MAYIGVSPSNGVRRVYTYTATANQTSFSGVGAENITLSYKDANYVDVYQNGVKLASGDYTATSGTAIVLGTGATVNDMVVIVVFDVFSTADTVSKADGGQFDGNVVMAGTLAVTGTTALTGNATMAGTLGVTGVLTGTSLDISGDIDVDGTTNLDVVDIDGAVDMASTLQVDGAITSSNGATITTADNTDQLTLISTDADANVGPSLNLYRNSGSPADSDLAGIVNFTSRNDNSQDFTVASLDASVIDVSDGTEDGRFRIKTMTGGSLKTVSFVGGSISIGDSSKATFGAGDDLQIYHDGSNSYIDETGTGDLYIRANPSVYIQKYTGENMIVCSVDGSVHLYHNNFDRLQTSANGIEVLNTTAGEEALVRIKASTSGNSAIAFGDTGNTTVGKIDYNHADNSFAFDTNSTERLRINAEGNILSGLTSRLFYNHTGTINVTGDGDSGIKINRSTSNGNFIAMGFAGTQRGQIGSDASHNIYLASQRGAGISVSDQELIPTNQQGALTDNFMDVGHPSYRFDDVRATNGTIQTSDRNDKQDIEELTDAEKRVAVVAKGLMRKFRWKDNVTEKGDNARTHFGIIAQDLQDAFTAESLDASKYAMFCSDTWWQKEIPIDAVKAVDEVKDEEGNITTHAVEAKDAYIQIDVKDEATTGYTEKTRLGVRYSELLAFIISAI
jgi:hypothetical protein